MITATGITSPSIRDHKPYRYRGIPDWNPAAEAARQHADDIAIQCPHCGARPGQNCHASGGRIYQDYEASHSARREASHA